MRMSLKSSRWSDMGTGSCREMLRVAPSPYPLPGGREGRVRGQKCRFAATFIVAARARDRKGKGEVACPGRAPRELASGPEERESLEGSAESGLRRQAEPVLQDRRVDPTEVEPDAQVAVLRIEVHQVRRRPDHAALDRRSGEENRPCG